MSETADSRERDPIRPWFEALEAMGDYATFHFGHLRPDSRHEPRWHEFPHKLYDGIGAFGHLLREAGLGLPLPENPQLTDPSWKPFLHTLPALLGSRRRLAWAELDAGPAVAPGPLPAPVRSWHLFGEDETTALRAASRAAGVTVTSFLLKHLDDTLRGDLLDPEADLPWMVPVNLRGKIRRSRDTANHSSYLALRISPTSTMQDLHRDIRSRLARGEHWAAWKGYTAARFLPQSLKRLALRTDRAMTQWNLGLFTNLGVWDPDQRITHPEFAGAWVVLATVLRSQMVGAACMTFQGRLSISVQLHPALTTSPAVPKRWMNGWVRRLSAALDPPPVEEGVPAAAGLPGP